MGLRSGNATKHSKSKKKINVLEKAGNDECPLLQVYICSFICQTESALVGDPAVKL